MIYEDYFAELEVSIDELELTLKSMETEKNLDNKDRFTELLSKTKRDFEIVRTIAIKNRFVDEGGELPAEIRAQKRRLKGIATF